MSGAKYDWKPVSDDLDDDACCMTPDGWFLRAEWMDKSWWWWAVYGPAFGQNPVASSNDRSRKAAGSAAEARRMAEEAYERARTA